MSKPPKLKQIKAAFRTKNLPTINQAIDQLLHHNIKNRLSPIDIRGCYNNLYQAYPDLDLHLRFLAIIEDLTTVFGGESSLTYQSKLSIENYRTLDKRKLKKYLGKLDPIKKSKNPYAVIAPLKQKESKEQKIENLISKLENESLEVYKLKNNISKQTLLQWAEKLDLIKRRIEIRKSIE